MRLARHAGIALKIIAAMVLFAVVPWSLEDLAPPSWVDQTFFVVGVVLFVLQLFKDDTDRLDVIGFAFALLFGLVYSASIRVVGIAAAGLILLLVGQHELRESSGDWAMRIAYLALVGFGVTYFVVSTHACFSATQGAYEPDGLVVLPATFWVGAFLWRYREALSGG
jgi:hypothetical protein